ncbi:NAD(P)H-dependent glycerol-3-phosphate dehydrogenase [Williamsia sp. CHRR-6]|uniref:NAD(P)H-dependent glycerol-3-phosphate dehydrogenase n=1 Tax=Williamsia sp. CHRR-6 TaxID=2835871 RepID=UPI001BDB05E6|nr:NAD(P)H-dependent glycerol-3-phosphate dehydrogenase [Williamsia sp. CHRR-6]MBT0565430.1 NAD(P)-dependent glycerol-3-phosphate dehydrogenase [Williamsia sp. CHRR-6]
MRVAVMGSGNWGTALATVFVDAGSDTVLWARRPELVAEINTHHRNSDYLAGVDLSAELRAVDSYQSALEGADVVVCAVPSQTLRANLAQWRDHISADATLLSVAKGVERDSLLRMSEVIAEVTGAAADRIAVLSGPNLAVEVAQRQPAATVIACSDVARARSIQDACTTKFFRPYTNTDVVGCEVGGAVKNVIALACGMASGAGLGINTQASIITRGLAETIRLGQALGARPETLAGLAGVGDLVATCSSPLSRNRSFGFRLGEGGTLEQARAATNGQVAEGVTSCSSVRALAAAHQVEMPLTDAVHRVCTEGLGVHDAIVALLSRSTTSE